MDFRDVSNVISRYAPALASVISTGNPVAGALMSLVLSAFGLDKATDPAELVKKLAMDPEAMTKLRQIELDHQRLMMSNEIEDRKSARDRERDIIRMTGRRDWLLDTIAVTIVIGYFLMCGLVLMDEVDATSNQAFFLMIGQLTAGFLMVLSYYFGSRRSDSQKE
jgi:hypothetical protein